MKNRAIRRHHEQRIKEKTKKIIKRKHYKPLLDDKNIGKAASVHNVKCSCGVCGNPRKYSKHKKTRQEIICDNKIKVALED